MLPRAYIVHQVRGRLRLRIREKRQDVEYFQRVCARLETLDGVTEVNFNSNTSSLLILHPELPFEELEPALVSLDLFQLMSAPEPKATETAGELMRRVAGIDIHQCSHCHEGRLIVIATLAPACTLPFSHYPTGPPP